MHASGARYKRAMLRRGMAGSWTQFVAVFCMAMLSVLAYTGLEGGWRGMRVSLDDYARQSQTADIWVTLAPGVADVELPEVRDTPHVVGAESRHASVARVVTDAADTWLSLTSTEDVDFWSISLPRPVEGSTPTDGGEGVWLSEGYMDAHGFDVGDRLMIRSITGQDVQVMIRGEVLSPDQLYDVEESVFLVPEQDMFSYGYVTPATATKLWGEGWTNRTPGRVVVRADDSDAAVDALWGSIGDRASRITTRETDPHIAPAYDRVKVIRNVSVLFASLFLLVGILAMYSSTKRLVDRELKTIATLQSMGYGRGELRLHFSMFGVITGLAGSVVGLGLAPVLSRVVLASQSGQFDLPSWRVSYTLVPLVVTTLVVTACVAGGFLASGSALTDAPVLLMRPGLVKVSSAAVRMRNMGSGNHWGVRWALRDTASNLMRFVMGIVGVAGCLMLLFTGFGLPDTMQNRADTSFSPTSLDYAYRVTVTGMSSRPVAIEGLGALPQYLMQIPVLTDPSDGFDRVLTILDEGDRFRQRTSDGPLPAESGLRVTEDTATRLGLAEGSRVVLDLPGDLGRLDLEVSVIVATEMPQGFFMSRAQWESLGQQFSPSAILVGDDAVPDVIQADPRVVNVVSRASQQDNAVNIRSSLGGIFNLMRVMAIILCVIVLTSLGNLTFDERRRQYATLSVLGMSSGQLRRLSSLEVLVSALIGVLLGIPGGLWFLGIYVRQVASPRLHYAPVITPRSVGIAVLIALLSACATVIPLGLRIARIDVVEALKEAE